MKNVIELFVRKNGEVVLSETETGVAASVTRFLEINQQLERKLTDLSRQFDLIENAIETIDDIETRTRLEDSILRARESLSDALLKLSRQIGRIVGSASRESVIDAVV